MTDDACPNNTWPSLRPTRVVLHCQPCAAAGDWAEKLFYGCVQGEAEDGAAQGVLVRLVPAPDAPALEARKARLQEALRLCRRNPDHMLPVVEPLVTQRMGDTHRGRNATPVSEVELPDGQYLKMVFARPAATLYQKGQELGNAQGEQRHCLTMQVRVPECITA